MQPTGRCHKTVLQNVSRYGLKSSVVCPSNLSMRSKLCAAGNSPSSPFRPCWNVRRAQCMQKPLSAQALRLEAQALRLVIHLSNVAHVAQDDSTSHCLITWADGRLNRALALLQTRDGLRNMNALTTSLFPRAVLAGYKFNRNLVSVGVLFQHEAPPFCIRPGLLCRLSICS